MGKKDKNGSKTFSDLVVSQVRQEIGNILKVNKVEEQAHNLLNSKNSTLNDLIDSVDVLIQILSLKSCTSPNDILVEIIQVLKKFMKNKIVSKILKYHFTKLPSRIKPYKRLCRKIQQRNTKQDKENIVSVLKCIGNGVCITYGSFFEPDSKQWNSFVKALVKVRFHKLRHEKAHQIKKELQTVFNIEKLKVSIDSFQYFILHNVQKMQDAAILITRHLIQNIEEFRNDVSGI